MIIKRNLIKWLLALTNLNVLLLSSVLAGPLVPRPPVPLFPRQLNLLYYLDEWEDMILEEEDSEGFWLLFADYSI